MKKLRKELVNKAINQLMLRGILKVDGADANSSNLLSYKLDKEYLTICNAFAFNLYNLGLKLAVQQLEQNPGGSSLEKKRAAFAQTLLAFINDSSDPVASLGVYLEETVSSNPDKIKFRVLEAVEYLKLSMQLGIHSKKV